MNVHEKLIQVTILGRNYPVRSNHENEPFIREIADFVDERFTAYRRQLVHESEITVMAMASMAMVEELFALKKQIADLENTLEAIAHPLDKVLQAKPEITLVKIVP
jgi:cell division protein ZapA